LTAGQITRNPSGWYFAVLHVRANGSTNTVSEIGIYYPDGTKRTNVSLPTLDTVGGAYRLRVGYYNTTGYGSGSGLATDGILVSDIRQYKYSTGYPTVSEIFEGTTTITGSYVKTGQILSTNYTGVTGNFATVGTRIDLDAGNIYSEQFSVVSGNARFKGAVEGGTITIGSGNSVFKADSNGIYLGHDTFASAPFRVTPAGALTSTSGSIGGWTINSGSLSATNISLTPGAANTAHILVGTGSTAGGLNSAAAAGDVVM
jgi:hypothetical protein